jgi:hypothetical protein
VSIYASTDVIKVLAYDGSHIRPWDWSAGLAHVDFAVIPGYVYRDSVLDGRILPYLRLSLDADKFATVLLTVPQARKIIAELQWFVDASKVVPRKRRP